MDTLWQQAVDQLYPNGKADINTWKSIVLTDNDESINIQAIVNQQGFIHMRKFDVENDKIKVEFFRFNKRNQLIYEDFTYAYKGSGLYDYFTEELKEA